MKSHLYLRRLSMYLGVLVILTSIMPRLFGPSVAHASDNMWTEQYWNVSEGGPYVIPGGAPDYEGVIPDHGLPNYFIGQTSPVPGINSDNFVARYSATVTLDPGTYTFRTLTDDGVRLYIDEVLVIDNWDDQGDTLNTYTTTLSGTYHDIVMEYYDGGDNATIHLDMHLAEDTGDGTSENPFQIHDCYELQAVNGADDANYILANDIDCSMTSDWHDRGEGAVGFDPISYYDGDFDGNGYTISDLYINNYDGGRTGLFSRIDYADVHDLSMVDFNIQGSDDNVGSLAGKVIGDSTVENIYLSGILDTGRDNFGGAIGDIQTEGGTTIIHNVDTNIELGAFFESGVGGLIGYALNEGGNLEVENCSVTGTAETIVYIYGGLIGYLDNQGSATTLIHDNTADLDMDSSGVPHVGGLIGYIEGANSSSDGQTINVYNNTVSSSSILGDGNIGGLVGTLYIEDDSASPGGTTVNIHNNTVEDSVEVSSGDQNVGGLIGDVQIYVQSEGGVNLTLLQNAALGSTTGGANVGGIFGRYYTENNGSLDQSISTVINQNYVHGTVNASVGNNSGGLIGYSSSLGAISSLWIANSYVDANVYGMDDVGGLFGSIEIADDTSVTIQSSYAYGSITADLGEGLGYAGGLIGLANETPGLSIMDSFAYVEMGNGLSNKGSIIGNDFDGYSIENTYYDSGLNAFACTSSGTDDYEGCLGVSAGEGYFMDAMLAPLDAWDFSDIWYERDGETPVLRFALDLDTSRASRAKRLQQIYGNDWENNLNGSTESEEVSPQPNDTAGDTLSDTAPEDTNPDRPNYDGIDSHYDDYYGHEVAPESDRHGISPWDATSEVISEVRPGWFIRGEHFDTVYEVVYDDATGSLMRRPFWNVQIFRTWANWRDVVWVTDATLATMKVTTPVMPKPGTVLVKIEGEALVYSVGEDDQGAPVLYLIPSEQVAIALYGADWADYVIDLPPTAFHLFKKGWDMSASDRIGSNASMKKREDLY